MAIEPQNSQNLMESFVWGNGGRRRTPEQIERDEKIAALLMKGGIDSSPIQHWTQGGARVMQALAGVIRERRAEEATRQNASLSAANIAAMLSGINAPQATQPPPVSAPQTPQGPSVIPAPQMPQVSEQMPVIPSFGGEEDGTMPAAPAFTPPPVTPEMPQQTDMLPESPEFAQPAPAAPAQVQQQSGGLNLSPQDITRLKKLALTEGIHSLPEQSYAPQIAGILDTALNRTQANNPAWGNTVRSVLNAPYQFSDINGPVSWKRGGRNDVDQIPDAWLNSPQGNRVARFTEDYLNKRGANAAAAPNVDNDQGGQHFGQIVGGHLNYANPYYSDASNLGWINKLDGPRLGQGTAIHHHGTAGNQRPVDPTFAVNLPGSQAPQTAQAQPLFLGDSHAAALARFGNGRSLGVNGANIAQSIAQLQSAPQGSRVFLSAGTNDAVGQFNEQAIRAQVAQAAQIAKDRGIDLTWSGPTGPRAAALDAILADATKANGVNYRSMAGQNFAMQPDGIHAQINPQGYGAMWGALNTPQLPTQPFQVAALGPVAMPERQEQNPEPAPATQVAQAGPLSVNNLALRGSGQFAPVPQQQNQVPAPAANPVAQAAPQQQRPPIDPRIIQSLTSPYASPQERSIAMELVKPYITPSQQQFTPLPNGMVLRKDPRSGNMQVVNPYNGQVVNDPGQIPQGLRNTKFGLNPIWGVNDKGEVVPMQMGDDGTMRASQLPDGVSVSQKPLKMDGGTEWVLMDPITRQVVGRVPKNVAEVQRQQEIGKGQGQDIAALPKLIQSSDDVLSTIKGILDDPDLDGALGPIGSRKPDWIDRSLPRVRGRMDQLKSQQFVQGISALRGLGALSDAEGKKIDSAMSRIRPDMDPKDYRIAVEEMRDAISAARKRAIDRLGGVQQSQEPAPATPQRVRRYNPATGNLE